MGNPKTYYEILGVDANASPEELKKSFREKALEYHPDRVHDSKKEWAHNKFIEIATAYKVLIDPAKREEYDEYLANEKEEFKEPVIVEEDLDEILRSILGKERFEQHVREREERNRRIREEREERERIINEHKEKVDSVVDPIVNKLYDKSIFLSNKVQSFISSCIPAYSRSKILQSTIDNALLFGFIIFSSRAFIALLAPPLRIYYTGGFWRFLWGGKFLYLFGLLIGSLIGMINTYRENKEANEIFSYTGLGLLGGILLMFLIRLLDIFVGNAFFRKFPPIMGWTICGMIIGALIGNIKTSGKSRLWIPILAAIIFMVFQLFYR